MKNLINRITSKTSEIIEERKGIRRFILLTLYPFWLYITYQIIMNNKQIGIEIYGTITALVGTVIGFYYTTRSSEQNSYSQLFQKLELHHASSSHKRKSKTKSKGDE